jgi:uncharacterized protein (TIGR03000 family)
MLLRGSIAVLTVAGLIYLAGAVKAAGPYAGGYYPGYFSGNSPGASYYQGNAYPHYGRGLPGGYYPGYFANYTNPYSPGVYPGYVAPAPYGNGYRTPVYPQTTPYIPVLPSRLDGGATTTQPSGAVTVTVHVPADADVWFDGDATKQQGEWREFASPPLTPGKDYSYDVRARWTVGGKAVDQTRTVVVHANDKVEVDFTRP